LLSTFANPDLAGPAPGAHLSAGLALNDFAMHDASAKSFRDSMEPKEFRRVGIEHTMSDAVVDSKCIDLTYGTLYQHHRKTR
jgi:hypothetical protein